LAQERCGASAANDGVGGKVEGVNVFIGMECSQVIQRAFEERGHNAWSCDLKPARLNPSRHLRGDVFEMVNKTPSGDWDLVIFHPMCRFLSVSGQHRNGKPGQRTLEDVEFAVKDFIRCVNEAKRHPRAMIENPVSIMSTRYRKPDQIIQPHRFGDDASKTTCLWLFNLPRLTQTAYVPPRMVCQGCWTTITWERWHDARSCNRCGGKMLPRWANQTDSGQNRLAPTKDPEDRRAARAVTYPGPAAAMAEQWGYQSLLNHTSKQELEW
jgi:hypothetical protein